MDKLRTCLKNVFPLVDVETMGPETLLGSIDGWDSMCSVNLSLELEALFGVKLFEREVVLTGEHRLSDVLDIIRQCEAAA
jgi:acyl carrier protein